jgi:hypothetical protein
MKTISIQLRKMVLILLSILLIQPVLCFIHSQLIEPVAIRPAMKVNNLRSGNENPMRLDKLSVDIRIVGQIAVTTLDMTYYNPNSRVMEGEFNFPLGEGQTVSRFALDIDGTLREGVVVDKEQGRKTFEAIVRRGVDPGLLEKTEGNNFRMRVYPLPAKGTRRVVIAFEQELTDKGNYDLYVLPLNITESINKFAVHAEVIKNKVTVDTEHNGLINLAFNKWNDSYVANLEQNNFVPDKQIALSFPQTGNSERVYTAADQHSDSSYFYVNIRPEFTQQIKTLPKRITLLWDNSNSALNRNPEKEIAVLDNYIGKIGNLTVELVPFNIKTRKPEVYEIQNGKWDNLKAALKAMVYDGGTSLGCLDFTKFRSDEILLVTDGITTFGNAEPKFSHTPVYTINSNIAAHPYFLTYIAQQTGGVYIDLNKFSTDEALQKLTHTDFHFISAQVKEGQVTGIYPTLPSPFYNTFNLAGKLHGKSAMLVLNFGFGSTITYSKTVNITADNSVDSAILSRLWAEKKIAELSLNEEKNNDEITRTGKQFGIVTSNTSLIVLERIDDYLNNDIVPPADLQTRYFEMKAQRDNERVGNQKEHLGKVIKWSDEQSKWWSTDFQNPKRSKGMKKTRNFVTPVIMRDEEVKDDEVQLKTQDELNNTKVRISVSDVKGNDETNGMDIADVKQAVTEEMPVMGVLPGVISQSNRQTVSNSTIELSAWDPQTPYLKVLQYATAGTEYATYLKLKKEYGTTPAFYADAADFFSKSGKKDTAITIISNLAELQLESPQLLRLLGNKLLDLKCTAAAVKVFEKVLKLKGEEPQSYRDLGLAYEANGNYQQAIKTLYEVVTKVWDDRFPGIELIVMNDINNIIALHPALDYRFIDKRLIKKEPVNIRVCLTWDTDNCDMDLWVTDPNGQKCFFKNNLTRIGGKISDDFTDGYGPEEFMLRKALTGKYVVQANYYGTRSQAQLAPVNLHLVFITNFGKPHQRKQEVTIRLDDKEDVINVGKFSFVNK